MVKISALMATHKALLQNSNINLENHIGAGGLAQWLFPRLSPIGPGSIPSRARVVCEFGSRSILARAGFLRALRFPPASKIVSSFHISLNFISGGVP